MSKTKTSYSPEEERILLEVARETLEKAATGNPMPDVELDSVPDALQAKRACFTTLAMKKNGALRGCTGTLVARQPLVREVIYTTYQTALRDFRFSPVQPDEVPLIQIELSILTPSEPLEYRDSTDLIKKLRPNIDGVTLSYGGHRSTFLPQVWEKLPDPVAFLNALCQKMGVSADTWKKVKMDVEIYLAEKIIEA